MAHETLILSLHPFAYMSVEDCDAKVYIPISMLSLDGSPQCAAEPSTHPPKLFKLQAPSPKEEARKEGTPLTCLSATPPHKVHLQDLTLGWEAGGV